jgi:hypothetical protein
MRIRLLGLNIDDKQENDFPKNVFYQIFPSILKKNVIPTLDLSKRFCPESELEL